MSSSSDGNSSTIANELTIKNDISFDSSFDISFDAQDDKTVTTSHCFHTHFQQQSVVVLLIHNIKMIIVIQRLLIV
jgi:hypothetical protein